MTETRGAKDCHHKEGLDGEISCYQLMKNTFKNYSIQVLGYVAEATPINAEYITTLTVERMLQHKTPEQVFLSWNAGEGAKKCSRGVNSRGTKFDSCSYVQTAMSYYNQLIN